MTDSSNSTFSIRLVLTLIGFPGFVLFTLPFYGIANSTSVDDRVETCFVGLMLFSPVFVLLVALGYSACSMPGISRRGRLLSAVVLTGYTLYGG